MSRAKCINNGGRGSERETDGHTNGEYKNSSRYLEASFPLFPGDPEATSFDMSASRSATDESFPPDFVEEEEEEVEEDDCSFFDPPRTERTSPLSGQLFRFCVSPRRMGQDQINTEVNTCK